jgi:hypothetical protein
MNAITQEQINKVKDALSLAIATSANVKAGKELWQIENRHWDDYRRALAGCGEALISAAEEGLRLQSVMADHGPDGRNVTNQQWVDCVTKNHALRARVQELEEQQEQWRMSSVCREKQLRIGQLENAMDKIQALARDRETGEEQVNLMKIEGVIDALSNSTPQPPRYTLEEVQQAFSDVATKSELQAMCGLIGGAVIRQLAAPQQKEEA